MKFTCSMELLCSCDTAWSINEILDLSIEINCSIIELDGFSIDETYEFGYCIACYFILTFLGVV